jgi:hypothetical protein
MKYIFLPESAGTRTARRLHEELETAWKCLEARLWVVWDRELYSALAGSVIHIQHSPEAAISPPGRTFAITCANRAVWIGLLT